MKEIRIGEVHKEPEKKPQQRKREIREIQVAQTLAASAGKADTISGKLPQKRPDEKAVTPLERPASMRSQTGQGQNPRSQKMVEARSPLERKEGKKKVTPGKQNQGNPLKQPEATKTSPKRKVSPENKSKAKKDTKCEYGNNSTISVQKKSKREQIESDKPKSKASENPLMEYIQNENQKGQEDKGTHKKRKRPKYFSEIPHDGYTQDYLKVFQDVVGGMIVTSRQEYVYIMEIFPSNFHDKSITTQVNIMKQFQRFSKAMPVKGHLYCTSEVTDINVLLNRIRIACPASRGEKITAMRNDYIKQIQSLSMSQTVTYRYFFIWKYEGQSGVRSEDIRSIYRDVMMTRNTLKEILLACGNLIAEPSQEDADLYTLEILYKFFNKLSYKTNSLTERIVRLTADCRLVGKEPTIRDFIAPRGMRIGFDDEIMWMDGMYYTYLTLETNGYPDALPVDWLTSILCTEQMDIHFFTYKQPHDSTLKYLKKRNFWGRIRARDIKSNDRRERAQQEISNTDGIVQEMARGDDLIDCCTVLVLYRESPEELMDIRDMLKKMYDSVGGNGLKTELCYADAEEYFRMTLPLVSFQNSIFERNKRNFTSTSFETVYCMTQYRLYDTSDRAVVIGREKNGTLVAYDKFNKIKYPNPHIAIVGVTGSGKSLTEMGLGRRDVIMGVKAYYLLPIKPHEYYDAGMAAGATFVSFTPDSKDTYNPMELFPEMDASTKQKQSILMHKITMLCTWLRVLAAQDKSGKYVLTNLHMNRIQAMLKRLYNDFGFTDNNESIWEDDTHTRKKIMPLIGSWYKRMMEDEKVADFADLLIPFVTGIFKNFNQQSNLDLSKDMIIFNVDMDVIGEDLLPSVMYLGFSCITDLMKADRTHYKSMYCDEVWIMLLNEEIGKMVEKEIRILRSYGGSVVTASQMIAEYTSNQHGAAILRNSCTKIIMRLEEEEFAAVAKHIPMDENDKQYLLHAKQGDMLIINSGSRTKCHLDLSFEELLAYTTDIDEKKRLWQRKQEMERKKRKIRG